LAPEGARFCPACGAELGGRGDERRVVTVLFADLVGFTALSETRDPEHVKSIVDRTFERLVGDVVSHGGRVDKIVGDAIVALFGAPVAHEDDAERAVRAGLSMQRTLAEVTAELGVDLRLRVGINTGEVLVGALRAGGDYTAMGDVVNTASRLETAAQPGQVLVGAATRLVTREVIRYAPLGLVRARGREEPVPVWEAIAALTVPGARPARGGSPFVGRDAELGLLRNALALAAAHTRAQFALVTGEAGSGKTRLAAELVRVAREEFGATVLEGRCVPYGEANVWWPLAEALHRACGIEPGDDKATAAAKGRAAVTIALGPDATDAEIDRVVHGLSYLLGRGESPSGVDPARARDEALRALVLCLEGLAQRRPLLLVLGELHWADDVLLEFIDKLSTLCGELPVLILATARPELGERWRPPAGRHNLITVRLDPLERAATERLVEELGGADLSPELRSLVVERSSGNPLFVEELLALGAEGAAPAPALPATLRGLVSARLDTLGRDERATLEDASVFGCCGPVDVLMALAPAARREGIAAALSSLAAAELLNVRDGRWEFRSELVRDVAYGTMTKADRARHHATAAAWLSGDPAADADQLAHHWAAAAEVVSELGPVSGVAADVSERAWSALRSAAARHEEQELWFQVLPALDRALGLSAGAAVGQRADALVSRARARAALRDFAGARADLAEAAGLMPGDAVGSARGAVVEGYIQSQEGRLTDAISTLAGAAAALRGVHLEGAPEARAEALRQLGAARLFAGLEGEADAALSEALDAFRDLGDRRGEAWALQNLAWAAFYRGDFMLAKNRLTVSVATFSELGDWGGWAWANGLLAWVLFSEGDRGTAGGMARAAIESAERTGNKWAAGVMRALLANVELWEGRAAEAVRQASAAREDVAGLGDPWAQLQALIPLVRALAAVGRAAEARSLYQEVLDTAERVADASLAGFARAAVAQTALELGEAPTLAPEALMLPRGATALPAGARGVQRLQEGQAEEAAGLLAAALGLGGSGAGRDATPPSMSDAPPPSMVAATPPSMIAAIGPVLALAQIGSVQTEAAATTLETAEAVATSTFSDRAWAALARGALAARAGDQDGARAAVTAALAEVDQSDHATLQAVARVGAAAVLAAIGAPDAGPAATEADERRGALGLELAGWRRAWAAVLGERAAAAVGVPDPS